MFKRSLLSSGPGPLAESVDWFNNQRLHVRVDDRGVESAWQGPGDGGATGSLGERLPYMCPGFAHFSCLLVEAESLLAAR